MSDAQGVSREHPQQPNSVLTTRQVRCDQQRPCLVCIRRDEANICRDVGDDDDVVSLATPRHTTTDRPDMASSLWDQESVASNNPTRIVHEAVVRPILEDGLSDDTPPEPAARVSGEDSFPAEPISAAALIQYVPRSLITFFAPPRVY
jgi:hypothetical protein